ncbi:HEPN/Toprim-associated domain-containing protein [Aeromonas veronii]
MGSYADIKINGHILVEWKNTYDEWYFTKSDRAREIAQADEERDFIGYRAAVSTIRRRLQLAGYDRKSLEHDFNETRELWIKEMKESLDYYSQVAAIHNEQYDVHMASVIPKKLEVLRSTTLEQWIKHFPEALDKTDLSFDNFDDEVDVNIPNKPLLSFMLSPLHGVPNHYHHGFSGAIFPCMQMESYAILLLDMCKDDDLCELDITDIVNGGWVDDFDDIEQVQSGETTFFKIFKKSIDEIQSIELNKATPVLQRMIFSSVITAMEAYLTDTMKRHVLNRHAIKRRFVESYHSFKNLEIKGNDIFKYLDELDRKILFYLDRQISFHDIKNIKNLFEKVLDCKIPDDKLKTIGSYSQTRHDIVHRNGKSRHGDNVYISQEDITNLIGVIYEFVVDIDKQIIDGLLDSCSEHN